MADHVRFHVYRKNINVGLLMDMEDVAARLQPGPDGLASGNVTMREMHDMLLPFVVTTNGRQLPPEEATKHIRKLTLDELQAAFVAVFEQLSALNAADVPPTIDGESSVQSMPIPMDRTG